MKLLFPFYSTNYSLDDKNDKYEHEAWTTPKTYIRNESFDFKINIPFLLLEKLVADKSSDIGIEVVLDDNRNNECSDSFLQKLA
jgi:hypothetical protein